MECQLKHCFCSDTKLWTKWRCSTFPGRRYLRMIPCFMSALSWCLGGFKHRVTPSGFQTLFKS